MTDQPVRLACPVCDAPVSAGPAVRTYIAPFNQQEYSLRWCDRCKLAFWTPLQIIPAFYEGEGFAAYEDYHNASRPFPPWAHPFFERLPLRAGKLLDVGCGDGSFLAAAKSKGFDCFGIDLDEKSVKSAIARFGLDNIIRSALDPYVADCREHGTTFDVVSFFEVLEHQDSPATFLEQVLSILKPGGWIAGSVPNARRFLANVDRRVAPGDLPPHHFLWFSQATLDAYFHRHHLTSVEVYPSGNISYKELREKLTALLLRKIGAGNGTWLTRLLLAPVAIPATALLWLGYRARPAHLYFQARKLPDPVEHG